MMILRKKTPQPWYGIPFLRILPPFTAGILAGSGFADNFSHWGILLILLFLVLLLLEIIQTDEWILRSRIQGLLLYILLFVAGSFAWADTFRAKKQTIDPSTTSQYTAVVKEPFSGKQKWRKTFLRLYSKQDNGLTVPVEADILAFFDSSHLRYLTQGSRIRFQKQLMNMEGGGNPGSFNWNQYWERKNIHYRVYFSATDRFESQGVLINTRSTLLTRCRGWVIGHLQKNIPDTVSAGLAEALLIGHKEDLDKEMLRQYANTGLMHVIAISGMHLGLIYVVTMALLRLLPLPRKGDFIRLLVVQALLWSFSVLTGAGPSILRSAVMYSLMAFALLFNKKNIAINSLFGSAFLLLIIAPGWIFDPGFQLSYSAVLSILLFYRPIQKGFSFRWKIMQWGWELIAVTLAAQILTTPISIYHFHQFPTYFLIANMLVVPLSSILLLGELLLCALFFSPFLAKTWGTVLHYLIKMMNSGIGIISSWPGAVWQPLQIDLSQVLLLYFLIFSIAYAIAFRKKHGLLIAATAIILCFKVRMHHFHIACNQKKIIIYDAGKSSTIDIIQGRKSICLTKSTPAADIRIASILNNCHTIYRVTKTDTFTFREMENVYIRTKERTILSVGRKGFGSLLAADEKPDLLWIRDNAPLPEERSFAALNTRMVVLDGSNTLRKVNQWKALCRRFRVPHHWVVEKGAFEMNDRHPTFAPSEKIVITTIN